MNTIHNELENLRSCDFDAGQIFSGKPSGTPIQGYASPSCHTPAIDPDYTFPESSRDIIVWLLNPSEPLYIFGPSGCGKTSCVKQLAARLNYPVFEITGHGRLEFADLAGHLTVKKGSIGYEYGPLSLAMRYGGLFLFNEIDLTSPEIAAGLHGVLDGSPLCIAENSGELIKPHPLFRFTATANTNAAGDESGLYQGTQCQNLAFVDRFIFCEMDYPDEATEEKLLKEEAMEAMRDSIALRQRLAGLLQAKASGYAGMGRCGKLDSRRLHRVCVGDARVFRRDMEKTALNTAVHILLDCSSSMSGAGMSIARKACYALVRSLAGVKGVNLALTAFPADNDKTSVYPVIRHGQKLNSIPSFEAFGSTPLGPALWWAMANMLPLRENRKIILVLSDGVPNSVKAAQKAISQCQKLKMEVMGIGIQSQAISNLLPDSGRTIWKLDELAAAMFELVRKALINGGAK